MPNNTVPADAEGLPKFDKAAIMRAAWVHYRQFRETYSAWQIARGIVDASFSRCLKLVWRKAHETRAKVTRQAKLGALMATPAGDRIRALTSAVEQTQYLSFRYSASDERAAIQHEINIIIEENA